MNTRAKYAVGLIIVALTAAPVAQAALLAYEPFNIGTGAGQYTAGALNGQNPTTAGFTGAWTSSGFKEWGSGNAQAIATGLTYPGLPTSGGAYSSSGITCRQLSVDFTNPRRVP